jgi:hypothetical protein
MSNRKYPPTKDRRDVGQVVFLNEKMEAARELSSCCVGTEAALETNSGFKGLTRRLANKPKKQ